MIAAIIDDEWLEWPEQELCRILDVVNAVPLIAQDTSQFLQHEVGARDFLAAKYASFELADKQRTRPGRKFAQKLPQPLDGRFDARHSRLSGFKPLA
jgi:hypothetical protein